MNYLYFVLVIYIELSYNDNIKFPCIIHLRQNHFVVLYSFGVDKKKLFISDPAIGLLTYDEGTFCNLWLDDSNCGLVVSLKPTPRFWSITLKTNSNAKQTQIKEIVNLFKPYKCHRNCFINAKIHIYRKIWCYS